jgi:hypothetical protein
VFVAGAAVSVTHGVQELLRPEAATDFVVGYVVLALSFALEGISFLRSVRQAKPAAEVMHRDLIEQVMATSDPTLRAVFAEDAAALIGLIKGDVVNDLCPVSLEPNVAIHEAKAFTANLEKGRL